MKGREMHPMAATYSNLAEVQAAYPNWFSYTAMQFFNSRTYGDLVGGRYFISSEQNKGFLSGKSYPRLYTIREVTETGIKDVGGFQAYHTLREARDGLADLLASQAEDKNV